MGLVLGVVSYEVCEREDGVEYSVRVISSLYRRHMVFGDRKKLT